MANQIRNGARITSQAWGSLRAHRRLLVFPVVAGAALLLVAVALVASLLATGVVAGLSDLEGEETPATAVRGLLQAFAFYLVGSIVVTFSEAALVATALQLAEGRPATVGHGYRAALRHLPSIVGFAVISATIGVLARAIAGSARDSGNVLVAIVAAIVGAVVLGGWSLAVVFAIPVMVAEDRGPVASLKRSVALFRETWGETFTGQTVIGGVSCLGYLAIIVGAGAVVALGTVLEVPALTGIAIALAVALIVALAVLVGAVNGIFQASLYRYATTGDAGSLIQTSDAASAFGAADVPAI